MARRIHFPKHTRPTFDSFLAALTTFAAAMSQDNWRRVIDRIEMLRGVITQGKEVRMVNSPLAGKLVKKLTLRKRVDEKTFVASSSVEAGRRLIKALDGLQAVLMPVVAPVVPRMYQNV